MRTLEKPTIYEIFKKEQENNGNTRKRYTAVLYKNQRRRIVEEKEVEIK